MIRFDNIRFNIGLAFVVIGVPLGMLLNFVFGGAWSQIIMAISLLAILPTKFFSCFNLRFNRIMLTLLAFQIYMFCFLVLTYSGPDYMKYLFFHLYVISLIFILNANTQLKNVNFTKTTYVLSSILTVVFAYFHYSGIYAAQRAALLDDSILDVFTMNMAAFINIVCCVIFFREKNRLGKILVCVLMFLDIYVIISSHKRSFFISVLLVVVLLLWKNKRYIKQAAGTVFALVFFFCFFDSMRETAMEIITNAIDGLKNIYGSSYVSFDVNDSSAHRALNLRKTLQYVDKNYSFFNYIYGYRYLFAWIDNPLLESYLDMGVAGFAFYFYLIIVYPMKRIKRMSINDECVFLLLMMTVVNIVVCITNNNPYQYFAYTPICLLAIHEKRALLHENSYL